MVSGTSDLTFDVLTLLFCCMNTVKLAAGSED